MLHPRRDRILRFHHTVSVVPAASAGRLSADVASKPEPASRPSEPFRTSRRTTPPIEHSSFPLRDRVPLQCRYRNGNAKRAAIPDWWGRAVWCWWLAGWPLSRTPDSIAKWIGRDEQSSKQRLNRNSLFASFRDCRRCKGWNRPGQAQTPPFAHMRRPLSEFGSWRSLQQPGRPPACLAASPSRTPPEVTSLRCGEARGNHNSKTSGKAPFHRPDNKSAANRSGFS